MEDKYESKVLAGYLFELLKAHKPNPKSAENIWQSIEGDVPGLGIHRAAGVRPFLKQMEQVRLDPVKMAGVFAEYREPLLRGLERSAARLEKARPSRLERNIRAVANELGLDDVDAAIFGLFARYKLVSPIERMGDNLVETVGHQELVATMLGIRSSVVFHRLRPDSNLRELGLILAWRGYRSSGLDDLGEVPDSVVYALYEASGTILDFNRLVVGRPGDPELEWDDYSHLGEARDRVEDFLGHCLRNQITGVNILLYGPPGTGKTEFAKTLAARLGADSYLVGEGDQATEPDRDARLQDLRMAQALLQNQSKVLLVFDEMEDVFNPASIRFGRGGLQRGSKVYTNRILENNRVPTIWIINNPYLITIAHIRRMSLAIELNTPPASGRRKVLSRILARHGCSLPEEEITELTRKEAVAPAVFDSAVKFARSTGGNAEDVRFAVKSIVKAIAGGNEKPEVKKTVSDFQLTLANADTDLSVLADNVSRPDAGRDFSLCLFGPPGTGKTEYVRYLASRMGMNVLVRRASDIFGPYIGQTEANIAWAFTEAKEEELFLVFDEADSFLADRKGAFRSWEVTQVNEMLTWMESHPLPFACTTNLMDHLDQASLRRFTLKIRFDFLTGEQAAGAFLHFFEVEAPAGLTAVPNLTPGDYIVVRKKAQVLGFADDPEKLVKLLATEVGLRKSDLKVRGFRNGPG